LLQWILFFFLSVKLFALEISIDSAKDEFEKYSSLHIFDEEEFYCQETLDDFDVVTEIVCAFPKKPSRKIQTTQNDFFILTTTIKKKTFFISIKPVHKIKLLSELFDLTKEDTVFTAKPGLSKRWSIVGYKEKIPLVLKDIKSEVGINFPFSLDEDKLPFVGSLDIKGNPVHIKRVGDVKEYINIKKYYEEKKYERCLEVIEEILEEYPNTLFKAELIYYKMKVYSELKDFDNVVSESKYYLREYSSNENVPEVLALTANAYANIGLLTDAEYFFDRLFSEHQGSVASQWGFIYMGDMLESSGAASKAQGYFKKALMQTSDLNVATTAAYRLATINLGSQSEEATTYVEKILNAQPNFFMQNLVSANNMMHTFADEGYYKTAAGMAQAIINEMDPSYDEYEVYLSDIALWLAKTDKKLEALQALNKYIDAFPDGDYIQEIEIVKDGLFFDTPDLNATARLAEYEKLIEAYSHDTIGNRAVYERAKLFYELGEFSKIIETKEELLQLDAEVYVDKEELVTNAAIGIMKKSLEEKKCKEVIAISSEYNISLSSEWDDGVYECAMKGGDYQLAKKMAQKNISAPSEELRKEWLYRYVKVDFAIGNYSEAISVALDLVALMEPSSDEKYKDIYRYLFDAYTRVEQKEKLVAMMDNIEKLFGLTYEDIERYVTMLTIGSEQKDDNMVIKYATKVMEIQKSSSSHAQSPYVEFTLYQSYTNMENYNKAFDVIESLNSVNLTNTERSRQKYLLGSALLKLWRDDEAKVALQEAIEIDPASPWATLAKSALNL